MSAQAQEMTLAKVSGRRRFGVDGFDWLCAFVIFVSFILVSYMPASPSKFGDLYFHSEAQSLAHAILGTGSWSEVTFIRAPAPVVYYAIPYLLVRSNSPDKAYWQAAVAWNALWMVMAVMLIRRAAGLLMDARAGKIAAGLSLIAPFAVYYSFGVSAETPAYVAASVFAYGWAKWKGELGAAMWSGSALTAFAGALALILCRPNTVVVLAFAAAFGVGGWWLRSRRDAETRFAIICAVAVLAVVTVVTLSLRKLPADRPAGLEQASNFSDVVFFGDFQFRTEPWDWRFWGKATRTGSVDYQNWVDARELLHAEARRTGVMFPRLEMEWSEADMLHHPLTRLRMFGIRALALNIWIENSTAPNAFRLGILKGRFFYFAFHVILNAIALLPLLGSIWFLVVNRARFFSYWPLWGIWLGLLLFHAWTYAEARYMLPGQPGLIIMAACAFSVRRRRGVAL